MEPNSDFARPQTIELDVTVSGVVQNEDVDYFVVEAKKGERISAEVEGIRLGYTFFDPYVAILDTERFELAAATTRRCCGRTACAAVVAPEDGKYIDPGSRECLRRQRIRASTGCTWADFPVPRRCFPAGGRPGETLEVRWIGDPAGELDRSRSRCPAGRRASMFELFAQDEHGIAPSPNVVRVVDLENVMEVEPNNARDEATAATAPAR